MDEETGNLTVTDIFNARDGIMLRPTGRLPTFVDQLVDKNLLDLRFLYHEDRMPQSGAGLIETKPPLARNLTGNPPDVELLP
jgi:hypothetical protein